MRPGARQPWLERRRNIEIFISKLDVLRRRVATAVLEPRYIEPAASESVREEMKINREYLFNFDLCEGRRLNEIRHWTKW